LKNKLRNLKNIKSLLIATNNKGKLLEIKKLLPKHITFYSPKDFNLIEPIENDKTFEGKIAFFPSKLSHCVYPFYSSDDVRISISGNIKLDSKK
jgi:inosine/xanthosine triphosphate pyrophosphatase family protein